MDKAEAAALVSQRASALLADAERRLVESIERAESRVALGRNARFVRHLQLVVLRAKKLAGSPTAEAERAWNSMSDDDIIAAYARN
jgi:hypothetical protein